MCQRWLMGKKRELFPNSISDQVGENCEKDLKHVSAQTKGAHNSSIPSKVTCFFPLQFIHHPLQKTFFLGCDLISVAK